jgi:hypothetical protein
VCVGVIARPVGPKISPFNNAGVCARVREARVLGLSDKMEWTFSQSGCSMIA